jgi:hypothetical protein
MALPGRLLFYDFVSLFIEQVKDLDHLIRRFITAQGKICSNDRALPLGVPARIEIFAAVQDREH